MTVHLVRAFGMGCSYNHMRPTWSRIARRCTLGDGAGCMSLRSRDGGSVVAHGRSRLCRRDETHTQAECMCDLLEREKAGSSVT